MMLVIACNETKPILKWVNEDSASCSFHFSCFSPAWHGNLRLILGMGCFGWRFFFFFFKMSDTYLRAASGKCARLRHKTVQGYENKCGWRIQTDHEHIEHIKVRRILNFDQTNTLSPAIRKSDLPASIERCCPLWLAKPFFIQACRTPINGKRKHGLIITEMGCWDTKRSLAHGFLPKYVRSTVHMCVLIDYLYSYIHTYIHT